MAGRPPQRTFSFEYHDDGPRSGRQGPSAQQPDPYNAQYAQPYRDEYNHSPSVSPPPRYTSPPPRNYTISPPSPPRHYAQPASSPQRGGYQIDPRTQQFVQPPPEAVPPPPLHINSGRNRAVGRNNSMTTPGADNLSERSPGGGIVGLAYGVAGHQERASGVEAARGMENPYEYNANHYNTGYAEHRDFSEGDIGAQHGYGYGYENDPYSYHGQPGTHSQQSSMSHVPLTGAAAGPAMVDPLRRSLRPEMSRDRFVSDDGFHYADNPYAAVSSTWDPRVNGVGIGAFDPREIDTMADDGDDGLGEPEPRRRTVLPLHKRASPSSSGSNKAVGAAAAGGGVLSALGGLVGRKVSPTFSGRNTSGNYGPVAGGTPGGGGAYEKGMASEKSDWLKTQMTGNKRTKLMVIGLIVGIIVLAIVGGAVGAVVASKKNSKSSSSSSSSDDSSDILTKDSADIKALMNNTNLHRVFPGMDYTPMNTQYPGCLTLPPLQNNVTKDIAVLSQLTNVVRLYGNDCNQTEMVLTALDRLGITDMKVWLGVWLENNSTTNARQLAHMYDILEVNGTDSFAGAIIGNEVLFRQDMSEANLTSIISAVRTNFTSLKYDLPVATADLGSDWTTSLVEAVDVVMANVHPFFGGVAATQAASWTWSFWQDNDVVLTNGMSNKTNIISEVGWPSAGGNDCGDDTCTSSTAGSVAGIDEMNTFLDGWVCDSLTNGTNYFWFEAFDEPWKIIYDTSTEQWEDKWGLLDVNRNLKDGLVIPDCNGTTVSSS